MSIKFFSKSHLFSINFLIFIIILSIDFNYSNQQNIPLFQNYHLFSFINQNSAFKEEQNNQGFEKAFTMMRNSIGGNLEKLTISQDCKKLVKYYLLGIVDEAGNVEDKNLSFYYLYKLFLDSSKMKSDLLTYDSCIDKKATQESPYLIGSPNTTYVVAIADKTNQAEKIDEIYENNKNNQTNKTNKIYENNSNKLNCSENFCKYSTLYENNYYFLGFCFPQGKISDENTKYYKGYCSDKDYEKLVIHVSLSFKDLFEINNTNVTAFSVRRNKDIYSDDESNCTLKKIISYFLLSILIIIIIINIFIFISKKCFYKKIKNNIELPNEIRETENTKNDYNRNSNVSLETLTLDKLNYKLKKYSKILYFFDNTFNVINNLKELFNSTQNNSTNYSGLTYIKGILGISMIFTILGQTFLILFNSPLKEFGPYAMMNVLKNFLYPLVFIGIRYCPRVMFSCSGYTLVFKYLSFLDKNSVGSFFIFIIYQMHKYFMLISVILIERFTLYYFSFDPAPAFKFLDKEILSKPDKNWDFFLSFLGIYSFKITKENNRRSGQNLVDYLWLPFNELFFFLFGIFLITIGYKIKLRIDILIIIAIILLFI